MAVARPAGAFVGGLLVGNSAPGGRARPGWRGPAACPLACSCGVRAWCRPDQGAASAPHNIIVRHMQHGSLTKMGMAKETQPARAAAAIGRWLGAGRPGGSRHRDVQGGTQRAAVLGAGDGLLTNLSLVLGVAGASTNASAVRLAGVAGLLAGAFSMAAGELVSVRAQQEMAEREVQVERQELADDPEGERQELAGMYRDQGLSADDADTVARILSANPDVALDTHARLELGIDPQAPGSAWQAAVSSFVSFSLGAVLPLFPWFFAAGSSAVIASVIIGAISALALGAAIGAMAGRNVAQTALRQLAVAAVAAAVTYGVGHLLGVSTS